jgi:hypothetical protein
MALIITLQHAFQKGIPERGPKVREPKSATPPHKKVLRQSLSALLAIFRRLTYLFAKSTLEFPYRICFLTQS